MVCLRAQFIWGKVYIFECTIIPSELSGKLCYCHVKTEVGRIPNARNVNDDAGNCILMWVEIENIIIHAPLDLRP